MKINEPKNPDFINFVRSYVAAQGFLSSLGATIASIDQGKITLKIQYSSAVSQHTKACHDGVIGALSVCRATVRTLLADGSFKVVAIAHGTMANIQTDSNNS
jgi:acyl-coenzyme A thioesterase PaaI-like protein